MKNLVDEKCARTIINMQEFKFLGEVVSKMTKLSIHGRIALRNLILRCLKIAHEEDQHYEKFIEVFEKEFSEHLLD